MSNTINLGYAKTETKARAKRAVDYGRQRILLVEDEKAIRDIVVPVLLSAGFDCREAADGRAAIDLLATGMRINLVLSNMLLPEVNGIELLRHVTRHYPRIPLAFVTAIHNPDVRKAAIREGAAGYLLKPFECGELLVMVRGALRK
jgi:CheY-like chemotaxis protein